MFERHARMLSDLTREKAAKLRTILAGMAPGHRAAFYNAMNEAGMEYLECNFAPIAEIGLDDEDGENRAAAIRILGLEEDSREVGEKMLFFAENDPHEKAQIAAVDVLGEYMFEEVLEEPITVSGKKLHEVLEKLIEHKNNAIRRAAVIAYAISETKRVNEIIRAYLAGSDPEELIANVLSPAKVEEVFIDEDVHVATAVVPDYQLSLAIGKEGQNVRLAAKVSGWKIDIKSHTQYFAANELEELADAFEMYGDDETEGEPIED